VPKPHRVRSPYPAAPILSRRRGRRVSTPFPLSAPLTPMSALVELRHNPRRWIFLSAGLFVVAGILAFLTLKALQSGAGRGLVFLLVVLALGALALALNDVRRACDWRVQVMLDDKGFRDRRAGNVLVPWERVRAVGATSLRNLKLVTFRLDGPMPAAIRYAHPFAIAVPGFDETVVRMDVTTLDWSAHDILDAVRRLAPHVKVEG